MGQRGRKSAAELSVIGPHGVETIRRPEPPVELSQREAETWRRMVNAYPADRFDPGAQPVLALLCRHIEAARKLAALIRQAEEDDDFDLDHWRALLRDQDRESGRIASLATRLRLTPQARYVPHSAAARAQSDFPKPWEDRR
jgi:hypothetical protein